jgi:hypothetical protein
VSGQKTVKKPLPLTALGEVKSLLEKVECTDFLKRTVVFSLVSGQVRMTRWRFSLEALEKKLLHTLDLKAEKALFYSLRPLMDKRLLEVIPVQENLCLPLTIKTVLERDLSGFKNLTVLLDIAEIFQDVGAYETARDKLKQNDIQVAVDMNATELDRLDADLLMADFLRVPAGCVWEGKTPLIWKRCLDANYLIAGKEKGVVLFEGPAIDAFCQALEV